MFNLVRKRIGRRWNPKSGPRRVRQWYMFEKCQAHMNRAISPEHETGVPGAIRAAIGDRMLSRAISVGAGQGQKELRLVEAGLVGHITLDDLSEGSAARESFAEAGHAGRMDYVVGDAFKVADPAALTSSTGTTRCTTCSTWLPRSGGACAC